MLYRKLRAVVFILLPVLLLVLAFVRIGIGKLYLNLGFVKLVPGIVTESVDALEQAEIAFSVAGRYADVYPDAQRGKGVVLFFRKDMTAALRAWKQADPEDIYILASWLRKQEKLDVAIDLLQAALAEHPYSAHRLDWWHGLVGSFAAQERWDSVIEIAQKALAEYPDDAELLFVLGRTLYTQCQDVEAAERLIKQAIAEDEDFAQAYAWMGHLMAAEHRPEEAYNWYHKANEIEYWQNWQLLEANMARSIDLELAFTLYKKMIEDDPGFADAYYELAWAYLRADEVDMAVDTIQQALRYAPNNGRYYFRAEKIIEQIKNPDKVISVCQEIAEINPENQLIKNKICP